MDVEEIKEFEANLFAVAKIAETSCEEVSSITATSEDSLRELLDKNGFGAVPEVTKEKKIHRALDTPACQILKAFGELDEFGSSPEQELEVRKFLLDYQEAIQPHIATIGDVTGPVHMMYDQLLKLTSLQSLHVSRENLGIIVLGHQVARHHYDKFGVSFMSTGPDGQHDWMYTSGIDSGSYRKFVDDPEQLADSKYDIYEVSSPSRIVLIEDMLKFAGKNLVKAISKVEDTTISCPVPSNLERFLHTLIDKTRVPSIRQYHEHCFSCDGYKKCPAAATAEETYESI